MKSGDKIRIIVPIPVVPPYDKWDTHWLQWISAINHTIATLDQPDMMYDSSTNRASLKGWRIVTNIVTSGGACNWIPEDWVNPYTPGVLGAKAVAALKYNLSPQDLMGLPSRVETPRIGYCVSCSGVGKHRLMCPADRKKI